MINNPSRRHFISITPFATIALLAACSPKSEPAAPAVSSAPTAPMNSAPAPTPAPAATTAVLPLVEEKDPQAVALGYVNDAARVDKVKFKNYALGSQCSNCVLYQGKAAMDAGPCPLFQGKNVAAKGWCTSWAKKA